MNVRPCTQKAVGILFSLSLYFSCIKIKEKKKGMNNSHGYQSNDDHTNDDHLKVHNIVILIQEENKVVYPCSLLLL